MIKSNVINILYRGGAKQEVVCLNPDEAASVWLQISEAMLVGLPILNIEDDSTATVISVMEIASCSPGGTPSAVEEQALQEDIGASRVDVVLQHLADLVPRVSGRNVFW